MNVVNPSKIKDAVLVVLLKEKNIIECTPTDVSIGHAFRKDVNCQYHYCLHMTEIEFTGITLQVNSCLVYLTWQRQG